MFFASSDIIIAIHQLYSTSKIVVQATRTVKGRHRIGQLRMATDIKTTLYVDYIDDIYIDDIRSGMLPTLPDEKQDSKGNLLWTFTKKLFTITLNHAQFLTIFKLQF